MQTLIVCFLLVCIIVIIHIKLSVSMKGAEFFETDDIPRLIHQTYSSYNDIPDCVKEVMRANKLLHPDYEFRFYDDAEVDEFIRKHTSDRTYAAFKSLNPKCGACKADFFRYIVLYVEGGVYADIKTKFKVHLDTWIRKNNKLKITMWPWQSHTNLRKYFHETTIPKSSRFEISQAVLVYPPLHPFLSEVVERMVSVIEKEVHSPNDTKRPSALSLTGPHMYTSVIAPKLASNDYELMDNGENLYNGNVIYDGTLGCYHSNEERKGLRYTNLSDFVIHT